MVWLFDAVVVASLLWLAWRALSAPQLQASIVIFVPYGLLMAVAWGRLQAPDVAIAEAAIGGGLTSALLLAAARRVHGARMNELPAVQRVSPRRRAIAAVIAAVAAGAGWFALWTLDPAVEGLHGRVEASLEASGVGNPVTAVLLNFRSWDTLLEIAVLVLALMAVGRLRTEPQRLRQTASGVSALESIMIGGLVRFFIPAACLAGGYLLWRGADEPGGAFQAGALLAGAAVIAVVADFPRAGWQTNAGLRWLSVVGLAVFAVVGLAVMAPGGELLEYPAAWSKTLILVIEAAAAVSIASILVALFAAVLGRGGADRDDGAGP
jgi:multisubunit Na+/H+ antiporter MnhB subunit